MFIVLLPFAANRAQAAAHLDGHKAWLQQGFADGVFVFAGSLKPDRGGAILAHGIERAALEARVAADPFVAHGVVSAEILDIAAARTDARLGFLAA